MLERLIFRKAVKVDVPEIVKLLADDVLGIDRENLQDLAAYNASFDIADTLNNQHIMVIDYQKQIIGYCELVEMYSLTLNATKRIQIEGVRFSNNYRGLGIGNWMFQQIFKFAREKNCKLVQLTTNTERNKAQEFYLGLGFVNSHIGMKLYLE